MAEPDSGRGPVSGHAESDYVILGRISGLYGVKGWVKVYSDTRPRKNILRYTPWLLKQHGEWLPYEVEQGRPQGKGLVVKLVGCDDRDQAAELLQMEIAVLREQLPKLQSGVYYWTDLVGLTVVTIDGVELGNVDYLFETGSNDVLVVKGERERLIPFIKEQVVMEVDLDAGRMVVNWDPDF